MKYRKKPVVIEAWLVADLHRVAHSDWPTLPQHVIKAYDENVLEFDLYGLEVVTLEGRMRAEMDDMLIRGVKGELYPCKPDIFRATYELVEGNEDAS